MARKWTLVTGGAGYVGSIVVDELLEQGHAVRVLDTLLHGSVPSLLQSWGNERFQFVRGDIRDASARQPALEDVEAVLHLAAIVGDPACSRAPETARAVNVEATRGLLDDAEAAGVERCIIASTCSNYGKMADSSIYATEDFDLQPVSLYAETKVEAELDALARADGLATCCLRFATVYGVSPRMRFDLTVNEFAREVALDTELVVFGEQFWRPYVHVRDAARAACVALSAPLEQIRGEVFNVGSTDENYRKLDIVELLKERKPEAKISFVHKDEDPRDYKVGFEKVRTQLGFETKRTVDDGIDEIFGLLQSGLLVDPYAPIYQN
jgi:nucleoside-diphosphate-sugar epimerase